MHCACLSEVISIDLVNGVVRTPDAEIERLAAPYAQVDEVVGMFG